MATKPKPTLTPTPTRKRRYDPNVPIDVSSEEENGECSAIVKDETQKLQVKVVKWSDSNSEEEGVSLKIDIDIPLRWVMICYCKKLGLDYRKTRFEFNAAKLRAMDTPHQLGMVHNDVIFAFPNHGGSVPGAVPYVTLCIRMHKERDICLRVKRSTAILPQLMRCFPNIGSREQGSLCFVYGGLMLTQNHIANELNMEDGDIIDGFNFNMTNSSLSIVGQRITLKVICDSGNETQFRVTPNTLLGQMMDKLVPPEAVTGRKNVQFMLACRVLSPTKTVAEEQLVDGDTIHSILCMRGC